MRWVRLLPLVAVVALAVVWALPPSGLDFAVYWQGGHDVLQGLSPYRPLQTLPFTYPPFAALVFVPFALLPEGVAYILWQVLSVAALVVATLVVAERSDLEAKTAVWVLTAGMLIQPVVRDVQLGQINTLVMLLVVLDLLVVPKRYRGLLIGIAAGIKLVPAAFAVIFLFRKEWASAIRAVVAGLVTVLLPLAIIPSDTVAYWTKLIFDPSRIGGADYGDNQSLVGVVARLLGSSKPPTLATAPVELLILAFACLVAWRLHTRDDEVGALLAMAVGGLLASPVSWSHHWVWVVPGLAWLLARGYRVWAAILVAVTLATHLFLPDTKVLPAPWDAVCYAILPVVGVALLIGGFVVSGRPTATPRPSAAKPKAGS